VKVLSAFVSLLSSRAVVEPVAAPLTPEERASRASSFGGVAAHYARYRPSPPDTAVAWILSGRVGTVVDLGAGTGGLSRVLLRHADRVVAVEPDDRMRAVLEETVPEVEAVKGRGEAMPLPDGCVDAVVASSSWHWVDPEPALREVGRVLVPGGVLGAVWPGPDPQGPLMEQARALLASGVAGAEELGRTLQNPHRPEQVLSIPPGVPFAQPERTTIRWDVELDADQLIGLLGTFSWVILMDETSRQQLFETARRIVRDELGDDDSGTVTVPYRAGVWRARRDG
jgi:SAM-dependent methyltransferase